MTGKLEELLAKADRLVSERSYLKALDPLNEIFSIEKDFIPALALMGISLFFTSEFDEAESYLNRTIFYNPQDFESRTILGILSFNKEHYEKARKFFEDSLSINANSYDNFFYLGTIEEILKNDKESQEFYRKCFKLSFCTHSESMLRIIDKNKCLEIFDWAFYTNDGLLPESAWSNLSYLLAGDYDLIDKLLGYLEELELDEVEFNKIAEKFRMVPENLNLLLDYLFNYYEISEELILKIEKVLNIEGLLS